LRRIDGFIEVGDGAVRIELEELVGRHQDLRLALARGLPQTRAGRVQQLVGQGVGEIVEDLGRRLAGVELALGAGEDIVAQLLGPLAIVLDQSGCIQRAQPSHELVGVEGDDVLGLSGAA
jgi:hypothetical protein